MTDTKTSRPLTTGKPTDKATDDPAEPKTRLGMSPTQLVGGALAAMTAAVIGAQLGVAGTVFGAAIGSIVAGVAGSLYTASLSHTKDKLQSVIIGRVGDTRVEVTTVSDDTVEHHWDADGWDRGGWQATTQPPAAVAPPSADPVATAADVDPAGRLLGRLPWKAILVSAAAVFLLAIAGITGFELVSGQSVSGGEGTTITQVGDSRSGGSDSPSDTPSAPSAEPSSESSTQPSEEASAEPSSEASIEPSSEPTGSTEASSEPRSSAEPSTTAEQPTESGAPSQAAGGQSSETDTDTGAVDGG